jgi:ribosome-binding factor A
MTTYRTERVGDQIRDEISKLISGGDVRDPRVSTFLSINRVEVTNDLSFAKVYVSSFMDEKKTVEGVAGLQSAAGFIQTTLSKKLSFRKFPKLTFVFDSSMKEGFEMVRKLEELSKGESAPVR